MVNKDFDTEYFGKIIFYSIEKFFRSDAKKLWEILQKACTFKLFVI